MLGLGCMSCPWRQLHWGLEEVTLTIAVGKQVYHSKSDDDDDDDGDDADDDADDDDDYSIISTIIIKMFVVNVVWCSYLSIYHIIYCSQNHHVCFAAGTSNPHRNKT